MLNDVPKSIQSKMKKDLHAVWEAKTKQQDQVAMGQFKEKYEAKYPKAWHKLEKDRNVLLAFYAFPAEHWRHIRTTNPIESAFAKIHLRHRRTKGSGTRRTSLAMMCKLGVHAEKRWRRLNAHQRILQLVQGKKFADGIMQEEAA